MDNGKWDVCYGCSFINWDGEKLSMADEGAIRARLDTLSEAGVKWVIVGGVQFVERADFDLAEGVRRFRNILDDYDIRISSHHCVQPSLLPLGEDQEPLNAMMRKVIEICEVFQPGSHVIHSGKIMGRINDGPEMFKPFNEQLDRWGVDEVLKAIADNIRTWGDEAAKHGTRISLENLGRFLQTGDIEVLPRLVEMIGHPRVGYCIDSGHAHAWGESVVEWIRLARDKLFETHFHDNRGLAILRHPNEKNVTAVRELDEHLPVGFGTISWMDVILALEEINFAGPVTFETTGWPDEDEAAGLRRAISWWRVCEKLAMERIQECSQ